MTLYRWRGWSDGPYWRFAGIRKDGAWTFTTELGNEAHLSPEQVREYMEPVEGAQA